MSGFSFSETPIPGALEITSFHAKDERGLFVKNYEHRIFMENRIDFHCDEAFMSCSGKNVIRGMHFQLNHPQAKLVSVIHGEIYDVIVDLRMQSPTFGQWFGLYLSSENCKCLYIPRGCAHGFLSMKEHSIVNYMCDGKYDRETDTGIVYNDPEIRIDWPINVATPVIVGKRDQSLMSFDQFKRTCKFIDDPKRCGAAIDDSH